MQYELHAGLDELWFPEDMLVSSRPPEACSSRVRSGLRLSLFSYAGHQGPAFLANSAVPRICVVLCAITPGPFAWKCICVPMQLRAHWRYAKSFLALFFGAAECTSLHDGAPAVLELTRWRSGVRVPTSLPFSTTSESQTSFVP